MKVVGALLTLVLLLAGCGQDVALSPGSHDDPVDVAPAPDAARQDEPLLVTPRSGMAEVRPRPFEEAVAGDDEATVEVRFWSGVEPCYVLDRVEVEETAETVTVTLYEGRDPAEPDAVCPDLALWKRVEVGLAAPVGDREIIDGAAGEAPGGDGAGVEGGQQGDQSVDAGEPRPDGDERWDEDPGESTGDESREEPAEVVDERPREWERHEVGADDRQVTVYWWTGVEPCTVTARVDLRETPDEVVITVYEGTGDPDAVCPMIAVEKSETVTLAAPLGTRRVVDGAA